MKYAGLLVAALLVMGSQAHAVLPEEQLSDSRLEARARHISEELRCVVCQNQTIDDSDAPLAHDLRVLVRERIMKGDTDAQVEDYIVRRYGTFVLLKPPFQWDTLALWLGPLAALLTGFAGAGLYLRARSAAARREVRELSKEEERELHRVLGRP